MQPTMPEAADLQGRLDALTAEHAVPGATAGVSLGDRVEVCASGAARLGGRAPVTTDCLFLIASVTKVWTATLVMQLVDEGRVAVHDPVSNYLDPEFRLGDPQVARTVTIGQLLCHSGGFFGDSDEPGFRDDDAVRRTVEGYHDLPQLHRPGALFSYSNAGYNVLGRLVECVTGSTWDEALRTRLVEPLGLEHTLTLPEEVMTRPHVVGHEPHAPDSLDLSPVTTWCDPRGSGPCGGTLATTSADLLAFARMHLRDGSGPNRTRVLSESSAKAMREPRVAQPDPSLSPAWSWGWAVERLDAPRVVEHGGNTCGQDSQLVIVPEHDLAVCVLTNGDTQGLLRDRFVSGLLEDLLGTPRPRLPEPVADTVDVSPFVGSYRRSDEIQIDVEVRGDGLEASLLTSGDAAERLPTFTRPLTYAGGSTYLLTLPRMTEPVAVTFVHEDDSGGAATHLALGLRVAPRL